MFHCFGLTPFTIGKGRNLEVADTVAEIALRAASEIRPQEFERMKKEIPGSVIFLFNYDSPGPGRTRTFKLLNFEAYAGRLFRLVKR